MKRGYIKLFRKIADNQLWLSEPFSRGQAWIDMVILANHKEGFVRVRGIKVPVKRGQLGWSEVALAERWRWSRGKVRRFLCELETVQQIVQQKDFITTLITITNYEAYQSDGTADSTASDTANGQQTDTNKNGKNGKNKNKEKKYTKKETAPDVAESASVFSFEEFWNMYDKKVDRAKVEKKYKKLSEGVRSAISGNLQAYVDATPDVQYRKNPLTWLNGECWKDEVIQPKPNQEENIFDWKALKEF